MAGLILDVATVAVTVGATATVAAEARHLPDALVPPPLMIGPWLEDLARPLIKMTGHLSARDPSGSVSSPEDTLLREQIVTRGNIDSNRRRVQRVLDLAGGMSSNLGRQGAAKAENVEMTRVVMDEVEIRGIRRSGNSENEV